MSPIKISSHSALSEAIMICLDLVLSVWFHISELFCSEYCQGRTAFLCNMLCYCFHFIYQKSFLRSTFCFHSGSLQSRRNSGAGSWLRGLAQLCCAEGCFPITHPGSHAPTMPLKHKDTLPGHSVLHAAFSAVLLSFAYRIRGSGSWTPAHLCLPRV